MNVNGTSQNCRKYHNIPCYLLFRNLTQIFPFSFRFLYRISLPNSFEYFFSVRVVLNTLLILKIRYRSPNSSLLPFSVQLLIVYPTVEIANWWAISPRLVKRTLNRRAFSCLALDDCLPRRKVVAILDKIEVHWRAKIYYILKGHGYKN